MLKGVKMEHLVYAIIQLIQLTLIHIIKRLTLICILMKHVKKQ